MGTAYKAAIPGATVTVSPEGSCRGRAAAPGSSPRRHAPPCAWQCWRSSPIRPSAPGAEHHARWRAGLKSAPAVATLPAPPQNHGSRAGSSTHILPTEYAPVTHRNAGVAGGAQINQSGPSPSGSDMSRHPRRMAGRVHADVTGRGHLPCCRSRACSSCCQTCCPFGAAVRCGIRLARSTGLSNNGTASGDSELKTAGFAGGHQAPWARAVIAARSANKPSAEPDVVPTGP